MSDENEAAATKYAIDSGWLVEVVNEHTCGAGDGMYGHEPGCGLIPVATVDDLLHGQTGWMLYNELVDRHNGERLHLQSVIDELKGLLRRACEADAGEDCWFDHNGDCQAHGPFGDGKPCPYPLIRRYLTAARPATDPAEVRR
jgi:hypothetical protein